MWMFKNKYFHIEWVWEESESSSLDDDAAKRWIEVAIAVNVGVCLPWVPESERERRAEEASKEQRQSNRIYDLLWYFYDYGTPFTLHKV